MEVICLETEALYELVEKVVSRLERDKAAPEFAWVDTEEAMRLLGINLVP